MARRLRVPPSRLRGCANDWTAPASVRGLGPLPLLMGQPSPCWMAAVRPGGQAAASWHAALSSVFVGGEPPENPRRY